MRLAPALIAAAIAMASTAAVHAQWKPAPAPLMTEWAAKVDPKAPLPEYPRPNLVRAQWTNLNGLWDYSITPASQADAPKQFQGKILVPFAVESALSGVGKTVSADSLLWYRRTFASPQAKPGERTLLHFGGVDWQTHVYVNGQLVAQHEGGHAAFSADITTALKSTGDNEIVVKVWDPTDLGSQPRGKQVRNPEGIWYTPVTGIWQTVWTETVPAVAIKRLKITPDVDGASVVIEPTIAGTGDAVDVELTVMDGNAVVGKGKGKSGTPIKLAIANAKLWSPDSPFLYDVKATVAAQDNAAGDEVGSYFAMRKVSTGKDAAGYPRLMLNNKPIFMFGPLDQGWWPDGLYTAPTDEALKWDIEFTKKLGLNMCRKHIKVEPARWYYWCDKLGLMVWQDQSSGMGEGRRQGVGGGAQEDAKFTPQEKVQFKAELREMLDELHNYPSVVVWVPFNEGWGQHDTNDVLKWTKQYDPSRLVDGPSGWEDRGYGDMKDMHNYPGPGMFPVMEERVSVLGEYGGLGLPVQGHLWQADRNWGYQTLKDESALFDRYADLTQRLGMLAQRGLSAAVYTQTTDVEGEVNGYVTYDRKHVKFDLAKVAELHKKAIDAANQPVRVSDLVPSSQKQPQTYQYTFQKPADGWERADFDASKWQRGPGGFGTSFTPGSVVKTEWRGEDIWLRRTIKLDAKPAGDVSLNLHHDDDVKVYVNGVLAYEASGAVNQYTQFPIRKEALDAMRAGDNVVAIHCHQLGGGQFIDFGFSIATPVK